MNKAALLIVGIICLSACQTIDISEKKYACEQVDWFEIGRSHGVQGLDSLNWESKQKECEGFKDSNHESYVNGWYAGVNDFCSSSHGFAYGKSGHQYNNVCPNGKEEAFLDAFRKGTKIYLYETDNKNINEELQTLTDKASNSDPKKIPSLISRINELETRKELNQALISEINRNMEENSSQVDTL